MDPEDESGSTGHGQNLHDLQNYLSTFNKEIEPGDDVLSNMDVDSGVGDVSDLYSSNPGNPLQEPGEGGVASQFSSGFYSEQGNQKQCVLVGIEVCLAASWHIKLAIFLFLFFFFQT